MSKKQMTSEKLLNNELIAYCGLYCGACSFKVGYDENDRAHIECIPDKYEKFRHMPLLFCPGCRLDNQCGGCDIKDCAEEKKLDDCSQCDQFPCQKLRAFNNDGIPHHSESIANLKKLRQIGPEKWITLQEKRWKCGCGTRYSWYLKRCKTCYT